MSADLTQPLNAPVRDPSGSFGQRPITTVDDRILQGGWKTRARGMWAGGYMGLVTGLILGAGIAVIPGLVMIGFPAAIAGGVLACIAATGAIGAALGMATGAAVGESAGPVASGVKEILRQQNEQFAKLNAQLRGTNADTAQLDSTTPASPALLMSDPAAKQGLGKYVNFKAMLTFVALGAAAGAILSFGPIGAGVTALVATTYGASAAAMIPASGLAAITASIMGLNGAIFGINYSVIFNKTSNSFGEMLAGRAPKTTLTASPALEKVIEPSKAPNVQTDVTPEEAAMLAERQKTRENIPYIDKIQQTPQTALGRM